MNVLRPKPRPDVAVDTTAAVQAYKFRPHPGQQTKYFTVKADIVIAGGKASGGKTRALLMDVLQGIQYPGYEGALFRKTRVQLTDQGGLWVESKKYYPNIECANPNGSGLFWSFPTGGVPATIKMYGCDNVTKFDGLQIAFLGIDQLEQFTADEFWHLQSRCRTASKAPVRIRATCNPEPGWLERMLKSGGYVGADGLPVLTMDGVVRWFIRQPDNDELLWGDSQSDFGPIDEFGIITAGEHEGMAPTSFTFVGFGLDDNPSVDKRYRAKLQNMTLIERRKKLEGNWNQFTGGGGVYDRLWWGLQGDDTWIDSPNRFEYPPNRLDIRWAWAFDIGWSVQGDWTVGILFGASQGGWWIGDMIKFKSEEDQTTDIIRRCLQITGQEVPLVLPHDPGKGGMDQVSWQLNFGQEGWIVHLLADKAQAGDKVSRHVALAPQAKTGHLKLITDWRPSREVSLYASTLTTRGGKQVLCTTVDEFAREFVIAMDGLSHQCPHEWTDVTDAANRGFRYMTEQDPVGAANLAKSMTDPMNWNQQNDPRARVIGAAMSEWSSNNPALNKPKVNDPRDPFFSGRGGFRSGGSGFGRR